MNNEHGITVDNLLRTLPDVLREDDNMRALATSIAKILALRPDEIDRLRIYPNIDNQPEEVLDILAYDFKVDWYDYNYPIEVKRDIIKNNVRVRKKIGTPYAVETALRSLHPFTEIQEWFEYGSTFPYFRIILDVSQSRVTATYADIVKSINMYKALRSKLEPDENGIIYRASGSFLILIESSWGYVKFHSGLSGQRLAGTYPSRSTGGVVESGGLVFESDIGAASFAAKLCGTSPYTL